MNNSIDFRNLSILTAFADGGFRFDLIAIRPLSFRRILIIVYWCNFKIKSESASSSSESKNSFRSVCYSFFVVMEPKEIVVHRSSVELIVIGLLAALVVMLAFPMLSAIPGDNSVEPQKEPHKDIAPDLLMLN